MFKGSGKYRNVVCKNRLQGRMQRFVVLVYFSSGNMNPLLEFPVKLISHVFV